LQRFAGDSAVGGILGALLRSYSRPGDNLPVAASVFFDDVDFTISKEDGTVGTIFLCWLLFT
jgi:hypothetical protein